MTPTQYCFPYFFTLQAFNKELSSFNLVSSVTYDKKSQMPESLLLTEQRSTDVLLTVPFGATLMFESDKLFYWKTDTNLIDIVQVELSTLIEDPEVRNTKIDLSKFELGSSNIRTYLDVNQLVTYTRKDSLTYNQDYYENFVIVISDQAPVMLFRHA